MKISMMKPKNIINPFMLMALAIVYLLFFRTVSADDTCMFMLSTDDVAPNITFLLDNGAEMEQIKWHSDYDNATDYTPFGANIEALNDTEATGPETSTNTTLVLTDVDEDYPFEVNADIEGVTSGATANIASKTYLGDTLRLEITNIVGTFTEEETIQRYKNKNNIATGTLVEIIGSPSGDPEVVDPEPEPSDVSGFLNENGYAITKGGILVKILPSLEPDSDANGLSPDSDSTRTWTINGREITLPAVPSSATQIDADTGLSIKDNAAIFRYSRNYLNWLFFSGEYSGDGNDLPDKSRFYYAKQALLSVGKLTANKANFGIYNFTSTTEGASSVQPLGKVVATVVEGDSAANVLTSNYIANINNMGTVNYSPLAEGLATIGGYYNSSSSGVLPEYYCQDQYVIIVSSGISSKDQSVKEGGNTYLPNTLEDFDEDDSVIGEGNVKADSAPFTIPTNIEGTTWLDDVAHYLYTHDMVGYIDGFQNVMTYTVGVMTSNESNLFLKNTSNNGNGHPNLYETTDSDYGKYHFTADSAGALSSAILDAVNAILTGTSTFTAPVVPVTRTLSGNRIYLALFKPNAGNFWEGNVLKFGLNDDLEIVDKKGDPATESNGALKTSAVPYWATKNWANADYSTQDCDPNGAACNYIDNADRNIYTYLGVDKNLTSTTNEFSTTNDEALTGDVLGNPTDGRDTVINYIRGADALDEDDDTDIDENREIITGDVLHSEPAIFEYRDSNGTSKTYVFFGANDGMLHAVFDQTLDANNIETNYGTEAWGFIPPDQLPLLKNLIQGTSHQFYVDSTPKIYFNDVNENSFVDDGDQVILICGERKGGTAYFALDITDPDVPKYMWQVSNSSIAELGESWSEPMFGRVKMSESDEDGTNVMFIGGGYSVDHATGNAIIAINIADGAVVKKWDPSSLYLATDSNMDYCIPSAVNLIDEDSNGFIDKLYVGDMGGRIWRVGSFDTLEFPECDENVNNWKAQVIFETDTSVYQKKFFYPPRVTLEKGYDLIFAGSGDREDACNTSSGPDMILAFKDSNKTTDTSEAPVPLCESDLVNVTAANATAPDLDDSDNGWHFNLETGEKILAEGVVFFKTIYMTSFLPNNDPCLPGGNARLYALDYKTGKPVMDFVDEADGEEKVLEPYKDIGGGIPSEPVIVISETGPTLFVTIGSPTPDDSVDTDDQPGILKIEPLYPSKNFFYLWWEKIFN